VDDARLKKEWQFCKTMEHKLIAAFQLTANGGPLCEEPMWGVAVVLEWLEVIVPSPVLECPY
jgi:translation elongation factor EF-G